MMRKFQDSIKLKLLFAMFLVLLLVLILAFFSVRVIELNSAKLLQNKEAEHKANMVFNTLYAYNKSMEETVSIWGISTNSYNFINGTNPTYETDNLNIDTLEAININLVMFYDASGNIYYQRFFDFDTNQSFALTQESLDDINAIGVYENTSNDDSTHGFMDVNGLFYYLVSSPVTKTDGTDMIGNLVFGRLIDDKELDYAEMIVNFDFIIDQSTLEDNQIQSIEYIQGDQMVIRREFDYMLSDDHIMIMITMNAEILDIVQRSILLYSIVMISLGLGFAIITGSIFNYVIFKRLKKIRDEINEISHFGNFTSRITHQQNHDEISVISQEINFMLGKINENEQIIYHLAYTDHLTNTPNRLQFVQMVESLMVESIVRCETFAIFFMDLDNFKIVNDTYGHHIGDNLIIRVTQILEQVCIDSSVISRIGGDEFLILTTFNKDEELVKLADSILSIFNRSIKVDELELTLSASIGIAKYPTDATQVEEIIAKADKAMYQAKSLGKNTYQFYDADNKKTEQ